jgi:hypothetical protein
MLIIGVIAVVAMVSIARTLFFGGGSSSPSASPKVNVGKQALTQTTNDYSVRMTVRGPLVADENYRTYTVTISPTGRTMTTYKGYDQQQIDTSELKNSTTAYEQLVYALNRVKLMDGTPFTGDSNDTRGICATGTLYTFDVLQSGNSEQSLWTSSCNSAPGSLKANLTQVTNLFSSQIPTFSALVQKMNTNSSSQQ